MSLKTSVSRARHTMHRRGVLGTTVRAAEMAAMLVYWTEAHKWLALDVHGERPHFALADGLVLDRGSLADFALIEPLGYVLEEVEEHLDAGGELWLVRDEGVLAFSCWIFPRRTPVRAARNGWLELPDDVVCLENSITAESHRGRGIAPATWARLADDRAVRGMRTMVTKVATDNVASLRAVEKAGFREIATMEFRRRGPVERVTVAPSGDPSGLAQELAARLDR